MINCIKSYILNNGMIIRGDTVWVALSGGADSSCLLHILIEMSNEFGITIKAVHVNHGLRGAQADADEQFCKDICGKYNIELSVYHEDVKKIAEDRGMTIEQAGRSVRYGIFKKYCPGKVALAHNMNDNAETLLMNLMRGSGTAGMSGISAVNGKYIRPLLKTQRADIEQYCADNNVKYVDDSSNNDTIYFRNAVRHKLLPVMKDITGKDIIPILVRASETMALDNQFIEIAAGEEYKRIVYIEDESAMINNNLLNELHPALTARVLRMAVEKIKGNLTDIENRHMILLADMAKQNSTGSAVNLPDGVTALVQFGKTIISKDIKKQNFEYILPVPGKIFIKEKDIYITSRLCTDIKTSDPGETVHYFSEKSCKTGFTVRNRRNGDIIRPWKGRGTAKLKKYFIDRKIPRHVRDNLMLITCGVDVAYIEGMEYGKDYMPTAGESAVEVEIERR